MRKKIAYISGTRADFGLMTPILEAIDKSEKLQLYLYVTGIHLMPDFGNTIDQVSKQFPNVRIIPATFSSDSRLGMARFTGDYLQKAVEILNEERPDFILILGDRVEMLCTALAATYLGIPTGHLHGGERTSTVDELARHAITKLASLHFAATSESAQRIRKLGEEEWRIHTVGAPALDIILNEKLPSREEVFERLGLDPKEKIILVVQHPVSEQAEEAGSQMQETIEAVKNFNLPTVVVFPHPDVGGKKIIDVIERERNNPFFHIFPSLEYKDWLCLEREAAVMVGNSSAGMIETASFYTPTVNIGIRQKNRERGLNVTDVAADREEIKAAIKKSFYDEDYLKEIARSVSPWGDGTAGKRIVKILTELDWDNPNKIDRLLHKEMTY